MLLAHAAGFADRPQSPNELARQAQEAGRNAVVVVLGIGAGNFVRGLREVCDAPIVVYEPDPSNLRAYLRAGPSDLTDATIVTNLHDLTNAWSTFSFREIEAVVACTPGYAEVYPEAERALKEAVEQLVARVWISLNTTRNRAQTWVADIVANVELLADACPVLSLAGQYAGVPAFVVGAGPSLDKNIELLREASGKGIVFATNTAALALAERGIEPQVLVCLESIDASAKLQKLPFIDKCVRAVSLVAAPASLRAGRGPLMPFYEGMPQYAGPLAELTGTRPVAVCSSVSTAAFSIARQLGCSPLVLVGQDLAYSEGKAYAGGTGYESSRVLHRPGEAHVTLDWNDAIVELHGEAQGTRMDRDPQREVRAWGGEGRVLSGVSFMAVHTWFEQVAELARVTDPELSLVNATEGGAYLEGFSQETLRAVLDRLPARTITAREMDELGRERMPPLSRSRIAEWLRLQHVLTERTRRAARRVLRLSTLAVAATQAGKAQAVRKVYDRLEQAENLLRQAVGQSPLVDAWAHNDVKRAARSAEAHAETLQGAAALSAVAGAQIARSVEQAAVELSATIGRAQRALLRSSRTAENPGRSPHER